MIDDLSPYNGLDSTLRPFLKLWRRILTEVVRDSCGSKKQARINAQWANSSDCAFLCQLAALDYEAVKTRLHKLHLEPSERIRCKAIYDKSRVRVGGYDKMRKG